MTRRLAQPCPAAEEPCSPVQEAMLALLRKAGRPMSAYELRPMLERKLRRCVNPPTVYRALGRLQSHRLVARIESRNAHVACAWPNRPHDCVFLLCDSCDRAEEIEDPQLERRITRDAVAAGFQLRRRIVELQGTCADCLRQARSPLIPHLEETGHAPG